jgi:TonB-dependent receptor
MKNKLYTLALLLLPIISGLQAQSGNIRGTVVDANTGEALIAATVILESTSRGATTDAEGGFLLNIPDTRNFKLSVSYIGYLTREFSAEDAPASGENLIIALTPEAFELGTLEVSGRATGAARGLIQQKLAENIKNVLSAEQITSFPDMNAAEAMQRIPGITLQRDQGEGRFVQLRGTPPQLTTFNVNGEQIPSPQGDVRYVGMDIISVDQIDLIEVTKVMTPDMDADGIGGSVNIITKDPETEKPAVQASLSAGYNQIRQTGNSQLQFSFNQKTGKFGFGINANYYLNDQGAENIEFEYAKGPFFGSQQDGKDNYYVQYREAQLRYYEIRRERIGISPTLTYSFDNKNQLYLKGMFNSFKDHELRRRQIYTLDDALSATYYLYGGIEHDIKQRTKTQILSTLNFGGDFDFGPLQLDFQLAVANASENEPDRLELRFDSPGQAIPIQFDLSDPDWPVANIASETGLKNARDFNNYKLDALLLEEGQTKDLNLTPRVNVSLPYQTNIGKGYIKMGGKIRYKQKSRDIQSQAYGAFFQNSTIYPGKAPALSLASMSDGFRRDNMFNRGYTMEMMPDPEQFRAFREAWPEYFIYDRTATKTASFGEDYEAEETISSLYGMLRHDWNRLMVIGGLRYEHTEVDYTGARIITDRGRYKDLDTLSDRRTHPFLLPQVQFKYTLKNNVFLRGGFTYTYSRPNFEDVLPYREEDRKEVKYGNPDLRYPKSMNVDFLAEKYIRNGIFSGGFFYKEIDDFIFFFKRFAHEGDPSNYGLVEITKAINGLQAKVYGAEIMAQFKLDFLPKPLSNLGFFINYTYTGSDARINKRLPANYTDAVVIFGQDDLSLFSDLTNTERITLPGQARHTANVSAFYETGKFYARLSANYQDAFLFSLGADADLDEYYDQALRLDFTANVSLGPHVKLFGDAINLTNAPLRYYLGEKDRLKLQEFYSWWARLGLKLDF